MTTDNQTTTSKTNEESSTYSRATSMGRIVSTVAVENITSRLKTLSLRPTRSIKKNNSLKPAKKLR
jgi:hypothetical protein